MIVRITDEKDEFFGFTEQARADITHEHCRIFIARVIHMDAQRCRQQVPYCTLSFTMG